MIIMTKTKTTKLNLDAGTTHVQMYRWLYCRIISLRLIKLTRDATKADACPVSYCNVNFYCSTCLQFLSLRQAQCGYIRTVCRLLFKPSSRTSRNSHIIMITKLQSVNSLSFFRTHAWMRFVCSGNWNFAGIRPTGSIQFFIHFPLPIIILCTKIHVSKHLALQIGMPTQIGLHFSIYLALYASRCIDTFLQAFH